MTTPRLKKFYNEELRKQLQEKFAYANEMQIPKLEKIVLNVGCGDAVADSKKIKSVESELAKISGQEPVVTTAKKSVATFKLREGMPIGAKVTLRKNQMYEFLDRLMSIALPRVRDFKGIKDSGFDGRGNYTLGVKEQIIFPEISFDKIDAIRGMDITIVTTARTDEEGRALLREMGMPFRSN